MDPTQPSFEDDPRDIRAGQPPRLRLPGVSSNYLGQTGDPARREGIIRASAEHPTVIPISNNGVELGEFHLDDGAPCVICGIPVKVTDDAWRRFVTGPGEDLQEVWHSTCGNESKRAGEAP